MRALSGICAILMLLFAAVQYNDPDRFVWGAIYGSAAALCAAGALRPAVYAQPLWRGALLCGLAAAAFGVVWYWPKTPGWWRTSVWMEAETAREGMGVMIVFAALIVAYAAARRA